MFSNLALGLAAFIALDTSTPEAPVAEPAMATDSAAAQPAVITNPSWHTAPTPTLDDYPVFASMLSLSGRATVNCSVDKDGTPHDCTATATPEGLGFDNSAVAIAQRGRLNPKMIDGTPVESVFTISIPFNLTQDDSPSEGEWDGPAPTPAQKLTGLIYAQSLASESTFDIFSQWGLAQLSTDRRDHIAEWAREYYIGGVSIQVLSEGIAMVIAKRADNRFPPSQTPERAQWVQEIAQAVASIFSPEANTAPLKARYCATYSCVISEATQD